MGVPAFYTWLMEKYPQIARKLSTNKKFICDYFYLDMNGIIHPCCHPEGTLKPSTEEEMIEFMCRYIDMLLDYITPKELLFISIDGPPPRAKMIQQRERRFIKQYESKINNYNNENNEWDSNQITPGTSFMLKVSNGLKKYINNKLNKYENNKFKILLSDSSVPGEGEHKILDFIRNLRHSNNYNSNAKHLLFSNDADMIFLSLLLHETNIYLMRDIPTVKRQRLKQTIFQTKFNIINFKMLTKYLQYNLSKNKLNYSNFEYNINRVIDDFVFLSYFIGNDFIPCLPFMNMRDGAFEYILQKYIQIASELPNYLVSGARINYDSLYMYLNVLSKEENDILMYRMHCFMERTDKNSGLNRSKKRKNSFNNNNNNMQNKKRKLNTGYAKDIINNNNTNNNNNNVLDIDVLNINCKNDLTYIKFGVNGYKFRYYKRKFKHELHNNNNNNMNEFINDIKLEYIRALSWIQYYYYSGVKSWNWCYKYHFAPLISDLASITNLQTFNENMLWTNYSTGKPVTPLMQLALVMPKNSAKLTLPPSYYNAIYINQETHNKIKKYYPNTFKMDLNFKELNWESIALISHVNVELLQEILIKCELNNEFKTQNAFGYNELYIQNSHKEFNNNIHKLWSCSLAATHQNDNIKQDLKVIKYDIIIPNTFDIAQNVRQCVDLKLELKNNDELIGINEKNVDIVSDTMCKFFMSGKRTPRNIVKYMKKRPNLFGKSVMNLRKGIMYSRKNTKMYNKKMKMKEMNDKKKNEKKNEKKGNDLFVERLKSIGVRGKMNGTNASQVIIDSVLSAIMNGNNNNNNNNGNGNSNNKNEIKCNVKVNKRFEKKKKKGSGSGSGDVSYFGMNKKCKRKMKGGKFKNMLKNDGKKGKISMHVHCKGNDMERDAQMLEIDTIVSGKKKKRKKKKKKKKKKNQIMK